MIEWTESNRKFASDNGDDCVNEIVDHFNGLNYSAEMIDYMLETPHRWACHRWEAIPVSKFGEVLKTIQEALEREEKCKKDYEYTVKYEDGVVSHLHYDCVEPLENGRCEHHRIVRRSVGEWEEVVEK